MKKQHLILAVAAASVLFTAACGKETSVDTPAEGETDPEIAIVIKPEESPDETVVESGGLAVKSERKDWESVDWDLVLETQETFESSEASSESHRTKIIGTAAASEETDDADTDTDEESPDPDETSESETLESEPVPESESAPTETEWNGPVETTVANTEGLGPSEGHTVDEVISITSVPAETESPVETAVPTVTSQSLTGTTVSIQSGDAALSGPVLLEPSVTIPEGYSQVLWFLDSLHTLQVSFPYVITDDIRTNGITLYPVYYAE